MNCLRNTRSLLSQIMLRSKAAPQRLMQDDLAGLNRGGSAPLLRRHSTSPRSFVLRWYHDPRKVAAATAISLAATVMAACSRYDREIVPCTYRSHLVIYSDEEERDKADSVFAEMLVPNYKIVDNPSDPRSARIRRIAEKLIHAAHRGLGIYDGNDAPMLRVTEKKRRNRSGKAQPHISHLPRINWEVILIEDPDPNAGIFSSGKITVNTAFFDWFKTDEEIAAVLAHEMGHVIARHCADITCIHGLLHETIFKRRDEMEADYIGFLLLGAAGFHPQWYHVMLEKLGKFERFSLSHPNPKKRLQLLSEAKTINEAMELYMEVTAMDKVTDLYFR